MLRDRSAGTELAALLDDVLAGRRTLRDVARTQAFNDAVVPAAQKMSRQWSELGAADRDALIERGRRQLEADRAAASRRPDEPRR